MAKIAKRIVKRPVVRRIRAEPVEDAPTGIMAELEEMSVQQLIEVIQRAEELHKSKIDSERKAFVLDVKQRAASLGLEMDDLFGKSASKRAAGDTDARRGSPPPKYRGPNGDEWSGRGRTPRWLTGLEAEGRKREEFAI